MRLVSLAFVLAACSPRPPNGVADARPDAGATSDSASTHDAPADAAATIDAAVASASCQSTLRLTGHPASASVWLTGNFVAWAATPAAGATPLVLGGDGVWTVLHPFNAGTYLYKFIVDGNQWILDPGNPDQVDDGSGNRNSRFTCNP